MKKIIYYISDHGKGHATRSIALIRELQKNEIDVIIRNTNSSDLIKKSLPMNRVENGITDVGPSIRNDGISIDENESKFSVSKWIDDIDEISKNEEIFVKKHKPDLIISDISVMPLLTGKKCKIPSLTISNFSWYDVLKFLPEKQLSKIKQLYDYSELHIQLPLSTPLEHFKNKKSVGFVTRKPTKSKQDLRKKIGIGKNDFSILFAFENLHEIKINADDHFKFLTMNMKKKDNTIDVTNWVEGQDLVSAVDLVICKCGYGFLSECLTNSTPFFYISSENHLEQVAISKELESYGMKNRISYKEISNIEFTKKFMEDLPSLKSKKIDIQSTINLIQEYL